MFRRSPLVPSRAANTSLFNTHRSFSSTSGPCVYIVYTYSGGRNRTVVQLWSSDSFFFCSGSWFGTSLWLTKDPEGPHHSLLGILDLQGRGHDPRVPEYAPGFNTRNCNPETKTPHEAARHHRNSLCQSPPCQSPCANLPVPIYAPTMLLRHERSTTHRLFGNVAFFNLRY